VALNQTSTPDRDGDPYTWNRTAGLEIEIMNATRISLQKIITLRMLIGYLGEKRQATWWDCGFLDSTGSRFLQTTFPRTFLSAAVRSTTEAARLIHDSQIGRIGIFSSV